MDLEAITLYPGLYNILVIVLGYVLTFSLSGVVVRLLLGSNRQQGNESVKIITSKETDLGALLGKCENFLGITFILANEVTGLALIFTAKSILRADDIKKNPQYYLGGTMVNFCFTVLMAFLIKCLLSGEL